MPNDDQLGQALGQLSAEDLQALHTATYQIRTGVVKGNYDMGKVGKLWDALQPVVARGGGQEKSTAQQVAESPAIPGNRAMGVFTPSSGALRTLETAMSRAEGHGITDPTQYETFLSDPTKPKTQWQAFEAGVAGTTSQLAAGNFATPGGLVMNLLPFGMGRLGRAGAESLNTARVAATESRAAVAAGETGLAAQHADTARAALQSAARTARVMQATAVGRAGVSAGFGVQGATQAVQGKTDAERVAGLVQFLQGATGVVGDVATVAGVKPGMMAAAREAMPNVGARYNPGTSEPTPAARPELPEAATPKGSPMPGGPKGPVGPKEARIASQPAAAPEVSAAQREEYISRARQIAQHPEATPEDKQYAASILTEMGATQTHVENVRSSAEEIIKGITPQARPSKLPTPELQVVASLSEADAKAQGMKRDDWLAARAEMRRRVGPVIEQPPATPHQELHQAVTRAIKGSRSEDVFPALTKVGATTVPEQEATIASFDRRSAAAQSQIAEINRVVGSKDTASEISAILREREGPFIGGEGAENVGIDPKTGRYVSGPAAPGTRVTYSYSFGVTEPARRELLNFILGDREPTKMKWMKDDSGTPQKPPEMTDELKEFVTGHQEALAKKIANVRSMGTLPSEEQLSDMDKHVYAIQAATGTRFTYKQAGKAQPVVGDDGVVRYPGVGDSQRFWNQVMGRPIGMHAAKPDDAEIAKRVQRLTDEAQISTQIAGVLRGRLPADHVAHPERAATVKPESVPQTAVQPAAQQSTTPEDVAAKYGLVYRGEVSPGTGVHDFQHPDGGSFALKTGQLGDEAFIQQKLATRAAEIKPSELSPALAGKAQTFQDAKQLKASLGRVFDAIDQPEMKSKKKFNVKIEDVKTGQPVEIPPTWHDAVFRNTVMETPSGELIRGASGSYDTVLTAGHAAAKHVGTIPPGHTLYVVDLGGEGTVAQTRSIRIYRNSESPAAARHEVVQPPALPAATAEPVKTVAAKVTRYEPVTDPVTGVTKVQPVSSRVEQVPEPGKAPELTPERRAALKDELTQEQRHLAALQAKGMGSSRTADAVKASIKTLEKQVGKLESTALEAQRLLNRAAYEERVAAGPKYATPVDRTHEGKSDDLVALLHTARGEEVTAPLTKTLLILHDLTPQDDRDYIAHTALTAALETHGMGEVAKRYAGGLQILRENLKAGQGPRAMQKAMYWAEHGKRMPIAKKPEEAGFFTLQPVFDILNELGKYASNAKQTAADIWKFGKAWLEQGSYYNVSQPSRDAMFKFRGELHRGEDLGRIAFNDVIQYYNHRPPQEGIDAMTLWRQGQPLPNPDAENARQIVQQILDADWVHLHQLRPNVGYLENYLGTIWKKPPGNMGLLIDREVSMINRAMLQGDRGMLRQRTFQFVQDGINAGGVPATYNPFEMALLAHGRAQQFIWANRVLFPELKAQGRLVKGKDLAVLAKQVGAMPDPVPVADNIMSSLFPVQVQGGGTALAVGERWWMNRGEHEMLQKWLAPDWLRGNLLGRILLNFKNMYTPIELLGPFHLMGTVAKSMATYSAQGLNRAYNAGALQGSVPEAIQGLKEMLGGVLAPYTLYKNGRALREAGGQTLTGWHKYQSSKANFLASPMGQRLSAVIPNIEDTIDGILEAGGRLETNPDYVTKWRSAVAASYRSHLYIKGLASLFPAALEGASSWLFNRYIPAVKLFASAREIEINLKANASAIQAGETTREAVMQAAVRRIDNIIGEMNWANINLSRGARSLGMLLYRSPGWRGGTADLLKGAIYGQGKEFKQAAAGKRLPKADPNLLVLATMAGLVSTAMAAILMALMAHKAPSSLTDITNPQTGQLDSRGKPIRVDLPLYTSRDVPEILTNPFGYAVGGQTGFLSRTGEALRNRDFTGTKISEGGVKGFLDRAAHAAVPTPFFITGYQRLRSQGFPAGEAALLQGLALNPSRRDLDMTPAEKVLSEAERQYGSTRSVEQSLKYSAKTAIQGAYRNGRYQDMAAMEKKYVQEGILTMKDLDDAEASAQKPFLEVMLDSSNLKKKEAAKALLDAYKVANESERRTMQPYVWRMLDRVDDPKLDKRFKEIR